jgi:hypothetical protein
MDWREEYDYEPDEPIESHRPKPEDDLAVLEIEPKLRALFAEDREAVFYETQSRCRDDGDSRS